MQEAAKHLLYSLERTVGSSGAYFLRNIAGIQSSTLDLYGYSLEMIALSIEDVNTLN